MLYRQLLYFTYLLTYLLICLFIIYKSTNTNIVQIAYAN